VTAYYNEIDPYAAQWLRNLIAAGHIARGDVDERSIVDVRADDLRRYTQAHFFAGIGGWSIALRLAGWPDDRPVWTGSCPCQPFSAAGAGKAADDERHLWPAWLPLIAECKPAIVFGEQVEAAVGWGWLDAVFADLEAEGYACGASVLPACSVGAPHIRQRLWFVADALRGRAADAPGQGLRAEAAPIGIDRRLPGSGGGPGLDGAARVLADADGRDASAERLQRGGEQRQQPQDGGALLMADAVHAGRPEGRTIAGNGQTAGRRIAGALDDAASARHVAARQGTEGEARNETRLRLPGDRRLQGYWAGAEFIPCTDGKARPVEPGTFPLAHGIPGRVGRLRAYGNAINPQTAAEFIRASQL
jgi:DNA (cytosine-5)-methyltransferase 1